MCTPTCLRFVERNLKSEDIRGKTVIEVGSCDVNGSCRPFVQRLSPAEYVGVDIVAGSGVDVVCDARDLVGRFGCDKYDLVICTETIEHIRDWQLAISNLKRILKPGGKLIVTTRSKGFWYHGWPADFWRYEKGDMKTIFSDFAVDSIEDDEYLPGVFVAARKPENFMENDLSGHVLYSIIVKKRTNQIRGSLIFLAQARYCVLKIAPYVLPKWLKERIKDRVRRKFGANK